MESTFVFNKNSNISKLLKTYMVHYLFHFFVKTSHTTQVFLFYFCERMLFYIFGVSLFFVACFGNILKSLSNSKTFQNLFVSGSVAVFFCKNCVLNTINLIFLLWKNILLLFFNPLFLHCSYFDFILYSFSMGVIRQMCHMASFEERETLYCIFVSKCRMTSLVLQ